MLETSTSEETIRRIVREEIASALKSDPAGKKAAIIASKGTLDWAYPPLILCTAAAAAGMETAIFFTFLRIEHRAQGFRVEAEGLAGGQSRVADACSDA